MQTSLRTVIVSGLSGSGKSTAIRALEDIGFFCIDNLPVVLLEQVFDLCERSEENDVAVVIDVREREFLADYERILSRLLEAGYLVEVLYLTCEDDVLIRRFKETRRKPPLQGDGSIGDGIEKEREALHMIRAGANHIIDTSNYNVHELRQRVQEAFRSTPAGPLEVRIVSFGFKHGLVREADYVFDVRFLPNPFFVDGLRELTGEDEQIVAFLSEHEESKELIDRLQSLLEFVLPLAVREGKTQVVVAIGCTGGRHRSAAVARWLQERLEVGDYRVTVKHRDIGSD